MQTTPSPNANARQTAGLVRIGKIAGIHGLKGAMRFRPDDPDSTILLSLARVYLGEAGAARDYRLLSASRLGRSHLRVVLDGIEDARAAQALKGATLFAAPSDLPVPKPGEFYYFQVLGMEVRFADGRVLGRIEEVFFTGANDVWVVRGGETEVLIPVIEDVVKAIGLDAGFATIEPIPGLLE